MTTWTDFLTGQQAVFSDKRVQHYGAPQAELAVTATGDIIADLSHLGLLEISGDDAQAFLQGQLTNDIKLLDGSNSEYAGYCTAKGRLLATLLLWQQQGSYFAQLDGGIAPAIMKRLGMFVLRSKVKIADAASSLVCFGVAGNNIETALSVAFPTIPQQAHSLAAHNGATLLRLPGVQPRFEIIAPLETAPILWQQLAAKCQPIGAACWDWLEIRAGVAQVSAATQEEFVPQMLNLDLLGGISLKKGCYTGQEIVARTHYLGKVKRRSHLAHVNTPTHAGEKLYGVDSKEPVGLVANVAPSPHGGFDLLAEIRLDSVAAGPISLGSENGEKLELFPLPYALESA